MTYADDDIVFRGAARTPIGKFLGSLKNHSATQLGTIAARGALERTSIDPSTVDAVYFGNVIQSSKDAAYLARHVGLGAGAPVKAPALTLNRACASGLDAICEGAKTIRAGEAEVVLAGGAENMSMTPYAMRGVRTGWRMIKSDVDDMLFSALYDPKAGCSIGETVEHLAKERGIDRAEADEAAVWSQSRAKKAQDEGRLAWEIVPVLEKSRRGERKIEVDENLRPDTTRESLAPLPGLYGRDGVVTAGNSSGLNDAGAAVVMSTGARAKADDRIPIGRLVASAVVGVDPKLMGEGPIEATRLALSRANLKLDDIHVIEINDSFTVQYIAVERALGLKRDRVNQQGGAIALGHPMGATGTRLVISALSQLATLGGGYGLCTLCVGGGQGIAAIVQVV
ncbi:MAG: thiolase family protein [Deltaproteobacteria bacterium]|jgi:acetyl-CoA acyltransferase 2